jgi:hypothetical protein
LRKMKKVLILVIFLTAKLSAGQNLNEEIKGHWSFCSGNAGYSEMLITDTCIDLMNEEIFGFPTQKYKFENDYVLRITDGKQIDTMRFQVLEQNKIVINWHNNIDTLTRINQSALTFYDFNCGLKMNSRQFLDFLYQEFMGRKIKNLYLCTPKSLHDIKNEVHTVSGNFEIGTLTNTHTNIAYVSELDYKIVEENTKMDFNPRLKDIMYNADSTKVLISIDYIGLCYDIYVDNSLFENDGSINLKIRQLGTPCKEKCHIQFYFNLALQNYLISRVKFNDVEIK